MSGPSSPDRVLLSYDMPDGTSGMVQVDASITEQHTTTTQVTEHPVESGPDVTDHIRPMPRRISLSGIISNTPIYTPATQMRGVTGASGSFQVQIGNRQVNYQAFQFSDEFDRVRDAYGELISAALGGALFEIMTTLATYENMAITNFDVPRSAGTGGALQFQIQFQEIRIVDTQEVTALPSKKQAPKHAGSKPTKEDSAKEKENTQTAAKRIAVSIAGALGGGK